MNIGDVILLVLLGGTLVALGFWMAYLLIPRQPQRGPSLADLLAGASHVTEAKDDEPEEFEEEAVAEPEAPSLPVDPEHPPITRTYHRQPGRPVRVCHCHGRELEDGEKVLFWPNPDVAGAFWLVCHPEIHPEVVG